MRTDHAPAHLLEERVGQRLGRDGSGKEQEGKGKAHGRVSRQRGVATLPVTPRVAKAARSCFSSPTVMKPTFRLALGAFLSLIGLPRPARSAEAGQIVYVGTYTDKESRGIYRFRFDDAKGRAHPRGPGRGNGEPVVPHERREGTIRVRRERERSGGRRECFRGGSADGRPDPAEPARERRRLALPPHPRPHGPVSPRRQLRRQRRRTPGRPRRHALARRHPHRARRGADRSRTRTARTSTASTSTPRTASSSSPTSESTRSCSSGSTRRAVA